MMSISCVKYLFMPRPSPLVTDVFVTWLCFKQITKDHKVMEVQQWTKFMHFIYWVTVLFLLIFEFFLLKLKVLVNKTYSPLNQVHIVPLYIYYCSCCMLKLQHSSLCQKEECWLDDNWKCPGCVWTNSGYKVRCRSRSVSSCEMRMFYSW